MPQYRNPTDEIEAEPNVCAVQMANGAWLFSEMGNPAAFIIAEESAVYEC